MIAIKHRGKFFITCQFTEETSRTCTKDAGGAYCGAYRTLGSLERKQEEEKNEKER